jgi:uncharacterized protein YfaS (alpha-2-macroglobulin family)
MKLHHFGLIAATLALGAWLIPGDTDPSPFTPAYAQENSATAWVDRENFQIRSEIGGLEVHASITNPRNATANELFRVAIAGMNGQQRLEASKRLTLKPGTNRVVLPFNGRLQNGQQADSLVNYTFGSGDHREEGGFLFIDTVAQLETRLVGFPDLIAGSTAGLQLVALNHATGEPVPGAEATLTLVRDAKRIPLYSGTTNADGGLDASFTVKPEDAGKGQIEITMTAAGYGEDRLEQPVNVQRKSKILLSTDKPQYQPGQFIEMRALCLNAGSLKPAAESALTFEVMDGKGNKVFKESPKTDAFGIASARFQLATEVNLGGYIVRAILGEDQSEKQVQVDRYVLPKFEIEATTDRAFYQPGDTLKGEIQSDYFFGKPVAGGTVKITASSFVVNFETFAELDGTLDENGHWSFTLPLPAHFVGTELEQGQASVRLEVEVTDTADHAEQKTVMKPVAGSAMQIHAIAEGGNLAPGVENAVYVLVAQPDGTPLEGATVTATSSQAQGELRAATDALGVATLRFTPQKGPVSLTLDVQEKSGQRGSAQATLETDAGANALLVRTDKTLYQAGDTLHAEVIATKQRGNVYFDLVREGQTVMTRSGKIENGKAMLDLDLDPSVMGSVVLHAYMFSPTTDLIRDTRLLYINPANQLNLTISMDHDTYRPGEEATLNFAVTDKQGNPAAAALGIAIVDESVFALQELHPGLEKIFFTLEQEIMKPRYEIHGFHIDDIIKDPGQPIPMPRPVPMIWDDQQQEAAKVLLASAEAPPAPPIHQNSFTAKRSATENALAERFAADMKRVQDAVRRYLEKHDWKVPADVEDTLLRQKYLAPRELEDPWGNRYVFDFSQLQNTGGWFQMRSKGMDGLENTGDDITQDLPWVQAKLGAIGGGFGGRGGGGGGGGFGGVVRRFKNAVADVAMPMAEPVPEMAAVAAEAAPAEALESDKESSGAAPIRIREYFPETLLFEPALITDGQGRATMAVGLADSITTWRMTTMASSATGALGSTETPLRVFQEFFVDLDLPVFLTQNDRVSIPVVLYNYLEEAQDVRLVFEAADWFTLEGESEVFINMAPGEVRSMYFPIQVKQLGMHKLTVFAHGKTMQDAIRREVEVAPDGEKVEESISDRLSATVDHTITIPEGSVAGAQKILVRVYPGVFSQIVDGLDSMLQMPSGCFEQTSSTTYPNILIVQYMTETGQINPELQLKAEGFINAGYQRLLTYEVPGGGFSWFGDPPANKVLTAWGLKEFYDMAKVHEVDPSVMERTHAWLTSQQESDGRWTPDANYLHAESWGNIQSGDLLVTAYIADALLTNGERDDKVDRAMQYIKANWRKADDAYTLALVANALVSWDKNDADASAVLEKLHGMKVTEDKTTHWKGSATVTFTHGDAADVEATALTLIAFMKAGKYADTTTEGLTWIIQKKEASGHWGSTQSTILALKVLTLSLQHQTKDVNASIRVLVNDAVVSEFKVTNEDADVMRLVDAGEQTRSGANKVRIEFRGEGSLLYQVVGRHYTPWTQKQAKQQPFSISVDYDKTALAVNDLVTAKVTVKNNMPAQTEMTIVDLGVPPGFQVERADLDKLVEAKTISRYDVAGRQVILYFEEIKANATIEFSYGLRAKFPLKAQTPASRVYAYYNTELEASAAPVTLEVK